jgi:putative phage-type endonuclease
MPELIPTATEAEWLEARRKGVTASEIAVILGLSPWSSPYALYHQKLGILPPQEDNAMMERGRVLEPYVVEKFRIEHLGEYEVLGNGRELYAHSERTWQLATPDRLLWEIDDPLQLTVNGLEPLAVLETKTASDMSEWGEPGTDEIPVHYRAQVLWQMDVMGVPRAYVAVLDIKQWEVREYVVEMDDAARTDLELMRKEAENFLFRIEVGAAPDVDWRPATAYALKQLHPSVTDEERVLSPQLARRYQAASRNLKHWEQRKKLYEAQIREQLGSARRAATADGTFVRRDVYEVGESVRKPYTVDKLVAVPPKKDSK